MRYPWLAALWALGMPAFALAQPGPPLSEPGCRLRIETGSTRWMVPGFDPFGNTPPLGTYNVTFINEGGGRCNFVPIFRTDSQPFGLSNGSSARVGYGLLDLDSGFVATPVSGRTERSLTRQYISLAASAQQIVQFQLSVPGDALSSDGDYVQDLVIEAEQSDGSVLGGRPVIIGVQVLPSTRLSLAGAFDVNGNQVSVNLGQLAEGVAGVPLQLTVESTRRYRISIQSLNNGNLRLGTSDWAVPYQVSVGDQMFVLSGGATEHAFGSTGGYRRESMRMAFIIGSTSQRRAGSYSDVLSIAVAPQ